MYEGGKPTKQEFKCPKCGSQQFYSTIRGVQYYNEFMEPYGYIIETESKSMKCLGCGHRFDRHKVVSSRKD